MTAPLLCAAVASALLAGCGGGADSSTGAKEPPASLKVEMEEFKFLPQTATVKAGGAVTFVNRDKAPHTAEAESFDTGRLDRGESKPIEFDEPGTYEYFCAFHPFMTATVQVD